MQYLGLKLFTFDLVACSTLLEKKAVFPMGSDGGHTIVFSGAGFWGSVLIQENAPYFARD
jgi:hypothetical protein